MPPHPLKKFEIQKYYQNEPKFNAAYSRNNLLKIRNGAYAINLDEFKSIETHWIALYVNNSNNNNDNNHNNNNDNINDNVTYFDSFDVEHIPKETKKFIENKNIITNIYRIQA